MLRVVFLWLTVAGFGITGTSGIVLAFLSWQGWGPSALAAQLARMTLLEQVQTLAEFAQELFFPLACLALAAYLPAADHFARRALSVNPAAAFATLPAGHTTASAEDDA